MKLGQSKGSFQNVVLSEPRRPSQHELFNIKCCDFHTRFVEVALNFGDPVKYTNEDGVGGAGNTKCYAKLFLQEVFWE